VSIVLKTLLCFGVDFISVSLHVVSLANGSLYEVREYHLYIIIFDEMGVVAICYIRLCVTIDKTPITTKF